MYHIAALTLALTLQTPSDADKVAWLKQNAVKIESIDPDFTKTDDLKPILKAIGNSRVVMLGEPSHGDGAGFNAKVRLIKFLHREAGFGVVAWESGIAGTEMMLGGIKSTDDMKAAAARGIFPLWGNTTPVQNLFRYAAETQATPNPLRMTGFDMQPTGTGAQQMMPFIAYVVKPIDTHGSLSRFCGQFFTLMQKIGLGDAKAQTEASDGLDQIAKALRERVKELDGLRSADQIEMAGRLLVDLAVQLEMIQRQKKIGKGLGVEFNNPRDRRMGENLVYLAKKRYSQSKLIGWGATFHFVRKVSSIVLPDNANFYKDTVTMGEIANAGLKRDMYIIATTSYNGKVGIVNKESADIGNASKGSFEDLCEQVGSPYLFIDLRGLPKDHWLRKEITARPLGYGEMKTDWSKQIDAFLFISEMTPAK